MFYVFMLHILYWPVGKKLQLIWNNTPGAVVIIVWLYMDK